MNTWNEVDITLNSSVSPKLLPQFTTGGKIKLPIFYVALSQGRS